MYTHQECYVESRSIFKFTILMLMATIFWLTVFTSGNAFAADAVSSATPQNELNAHRGESKAEIHFDTISSIDEFLDIVVNIMDDNGTLRSIERSDEEYVPGTWYAYIDDNTGHGVIKIFDTEEKGDNLYKAIAIGTVENPEALWRFSYKEEEQEGVYCLRTGGLDTPKGFNEMGLSFMNLEIRCDFNIDEADKLNFYLYDKDYKLLKEIPKSREAGKLEYFCVRLSDIGNDETVLRFFDTKTDDENEKGVNGDYYRDTHIKIENPKGEITWADVYYVEGQRKIFVREGKAPELEEKEEASETEVIVDETIQETEVIETLENTNDPTKRSYKDIFSFIVVALVGLGAYLTATKRSDYK